MSEQKDCNNCRIDPLEPNNGHCTQCQEYDGWQPDPQTKVMLKLKVKCRDNFVYVDPEEIQSMYVWNGRTHITTMGLQNHDYAYEVEETPEKIFEAAGDLITIKECK